MDIYGNVYIEVVPRFFKNTVIYSPNLRNNLNMKRRSKPEMTCRHRDMVSS